MSQLLYPMLLPRPIYDLNFPLVATPQYVSGRDFVGITHQLPGFMQCRLLGRAWNMFFTRSAYWVQVAQRWYIQANGFTKVNSNDSSFPPAVVGANGASCESRSVPNGVLMSKASSLERLMVGRDLAAGSSGTSSSIAARALCETHFPRPSECSMAIDHVASKMPSQQRAPWRPAPLFDSPVMLPCGDSLVSASTNLMMRICVFCCRCFYIPAGYGKHCLQRVNAQIRSSRMLADQLMRCKH